METITLERAQYDALMDMKRDLERGGVHNQLGTLSNNNYVSTAPGVRQLFIDLLDDFEKEISGQNKKVESDIEKHNKQVAKDKDHIKELEKRFNARIKEKSKVLTECINKILPNTDYTCTEEAIGYVLLKINRLEESIDMRDDYIKGIKEMSFFERLKFLLTKNI